MLRLLIKLYERAEQPDWISIAQCLMFLDDAPEVAKILHRLLQGTEVCTSLRHMLNMTGTFGVLWS